MIVEFEDDEDDLITRVCDKCEGGYTPSPSQFRCIPKIEYSVIDLDDQELSADDLYLLAASTPVRVADLENDVWIVPCKDGFYWDDTDSNPDNWRCVECLIEDCVVCSSDIECTECSEGKLLQADGSECIDYLECIVPHHLQPERLEERDGKWICTECNVGEYFCEEDECDDGAGCYSCADDLDENCRNCGIIEDIDDTDDVLQCFNCAPGFIVGNDGYCQIPSIEGC